jgi:glycosyltransferase involved in cell wall biosynthesis
VSDNLDLILVVGAFPQLSETFIWRKALALCARGHRVRIATRERRNAEGLLASPLPSNLSVSELIPEWGLRRPARLWAALTRTVWYSARRPRAALLLFLKCRRDPRTAGDAGRHFLRHLWFLDQHCDVLHFEFLPLAGLYPLAAELVGAPEVVSCRGSDLHLFEQAEPGARNLGLASLLRVGRVHCVSAKMAAVVERVSGRHDGVFVNRPAVEVNHPPAKTPQGPGQAPLVIGVGRLVWIKGFDYLLEAFARLKRDKVAFSAEIIGGGPLTAELRFSVLDLDLADQVTITGPRSPAAVQARLQDADVFVLSSVAEGISNAALEAMAVGVPVVTTAAGGMVEAVTDGVEGFVVPVRDVESLTARLRQLLSNQIQREEMGRAARARIVAGFSLTRQAAVFEEEYRTLVRQRAESAR